MYFHSFKKQGLILDILQDLRAINSIAVHAKKTGMIILGGGLVKHHICNANLMRNGADFSVFINTGQEFDGSDSGAQPDEAISWGKIRMNAQPVKVYAEATLVFPLIVAKTFAAHVSNLQTGSNLLSHPLSPPSPPPCLHNTSSSPSSSSLTRRDFSLY
jgi:deoxyhypusine synthase